MSKSATGPAPDIFIIDDKAEVRNVIRRQLLKLKDTPIGDIADFANSRTCLAAVRKLPLNPNLLAFVDIRLQGGRITDFSGLRLAKQLQGLYGIPVAFVTAFDDSMMYDRAATVKNQLGFFGKPPETNQLRYAIRRAVAERASDEEKSTEYSFHVNKQGWLTCASPGLRKLISLNGGSRRLDRDSVLGLFIDAYAKKRQSQVIVTNRGTLGSNAREAIRARRSRIISPFEEKIRDLSHGKLGTRVEIRDVTDTFQLGRKVASPGKKPIVLVGSSRIEVEGSFEIIDQFDCVVLDAPVHDGACGEPCCNVQFTNDDISFSETVPLARLDAEGCADVGSVFVYYLAKGGSVLLSAVVPADRGPQNLEPKFTKEEASFFRKLRSGD